MPRMWRGRGSGTKRGFGFADFVLARCCSQKAKGSPETVVSPYSSSRHRSGLLLLLRLLLLLVLREGLSLLSLLRMVLLQGLAALLDGRGHGLLRIHFSHLFEGRVEFALHGIGAACITAQRHVVDAGHAFMARGDGQGRGKAITPIVRCALMLRVDAVYALLRLVVQPVVRVRGTVEPRCAVLLCAVKRRHGARSGDAVGREAMRLLELLHGFLCMRAEAAVRLQAMSVRIGHAHRVELLLKRLYFGAARSFAQRGM